MISRIDNAFLNYIQGNMRCSFLDRIMPEISLLGNGGLIWIILTAAMLFSKDYKKIGLTLTVGLTLSLVMGNMILKPLIARPRPCWSEAGMQLLIAMPRDFSFPSGHTLSSTISTVIILLYNKKIGTAAVILALLIAFSRLYLYVHYPTDVLGGILIGIVIAIAAYRIMNGAHLFFSLF